MPARSTESQKICFQRGLAATVKESGFSDVTVITGETEALGHGIYVDEKSIDGLMTLLMGRSIPGYLTHDGAMFGDRLGKEIGIFSGFYRDGNKLKAKQFRFLNAFVKNDSETYEKLVELARELPDQFGLSVVFSGRAVWAMEDGSDVDADVPMPEGAMRGIPSVRFESIESADFVKAPAANPGGLFAKSVDGGGKGMSHAIAINFSGHSFSSVTDWADHVAQGASGGAAGASAGSYTFFSYPNDKDAEISALAASMDKERADALAAKDGELAKLKSDHKAELDAVKAQLAEALTFDIRKTGVRHDDAPSANTQEPTVLPEPAKDDKGLWAQYHALAAKDAKLAEAFKAKHMTADRYAKRR